MNQQRQQQRIPDAREVYGQETNASWAPTGMQIAGGLFTAAAGFMAAVGFVFVYFDVVSSYDGWGYMIAQALTIRHAEILAWAGTLVPTLIQLGYWAAKTAKVETGTGRPITANFWFKNAMFASCVMDTVMDIVGMSRLQSTISISVATVVAVGLFGILSEYMLMFMFPVFVSRLRGWWAKADTEMSIE